MTSNVAHIKPFSERVAELSERLYYGCLNICHDKDKAEDLKQETIYQALTSDYDERNFLYTWLYKIAENTFLQSLRKEKKIVYLPEYADIIVDETPEEEEKICINKGFDYYLNQLTDMEQRIFKLRYIGTSYSEIARKMGMSEKSHMIRSEKALKARYWLIKDKLRQMIQNYN